MIDWTILSNKFDRLTASSKFEKLALEYVKDVYSEYTWVPTISSRDDNRDAHIGIGTDFDIWEEAKYKGKNYKVRRQDIDTTILSGIIQGNVKMIIFVSNALVPEHLYSRADITAKMKGIEITYALDAQLESWLIKHKNIYETIFEEKMDIDIESDKVCFIKDIYVYDTVASEFNSLPQNSELIIGEMYILSISIESSSIGKAEIELEDKFPFIVMENEQFDRVTDISLNQGINVINLLVKAVAEYNNRVSIRININGSPYFKTTQHLLIQPNDNLPIVYSSQIEILHNIKSIINAYSNSTATYIITLFAKSGMGKSYVLNRIYTDFLFKRDMVTIDFEISEINNINYQLLCKVLLYLNFGNVFLYLNTNITRDRVYLKKIIKDRVENNNLSYSELCQIIDGCSNITSAMKAINNIIKKCRSNKNYIIIAPKNGRINKLLLLDDIQYLNDIQYEFIDIVCRQIEKVKKNITIVLSGTEGKFNSIERENDFKELAINMFSIRGLSNSDKLESMKHIVSDINNDDIDIIDNIIPDSPLLAYEVVHNIRASCDNIGIFNIINNYKSGIDGNAIFQNKFKNLNKMCLQLLDAIYIFKLGIKYDIIEKYYLEKDIKIKSQIDYLEKLRLLNKRENIVRPYHDYCISSYKKFRNKKMYNSKNATFLEYILKQHSNVDENLVISSIIKCGKKYFAKYKNTINSIILDNIHNTNFGTALYYCEYYYKNLYGRKDSTYTSDELYYLYLYSDCLVHCGKSGEAENIFEWICKITDKGTIEHTEAGTSLLNQKFWHLNLDKVIADSFILQNSAEQLLESGLSDENLIRMTKAYDSCFNRRMVTQLILDDYDDAKKTYIKRLRIINDTSATPEKFCNDSATLIMDYARGLAYFDINQANKLINVAKKYYANNFNKQYRRAILCNIDSLLFSCILNNTFHESEFKNYLYKLKQEKFNFEYFKANLKYYACKLVSETEMIRKSGGNRFNSSTVSETYSIIHQCLLEINIHPEYREKYLYNLLISYTYIMNNNYEKAKKCLDDAKQFIFPAGKSHLLSINHNLKNMKKIKRIEWYFKGKSLKKDCFYLDSRFW